MLVMSRHSKNGGRIFGFTTVRLPVSPCVNFCPVHITKTCLYNFDPLEPHFYIVKLRFTGYTFFFLLKNIDCGYTLEPHRRGGSNKYQQCMF